MKHAQCRCHEVGDEAAAKGNKLTGHRDGGGVQAMKALESRL
jgi:hypothetical protein